MNEKTKEYLCEPCLFRTRKPKEYERHIHTKKHKNNVDEINNNSVVCINTQIIIKCACGKIYKTRSGFRKHKLTCEAEVVPINENNHTKYEDVSNTEPVIQNVFATPVEISVEHQIKLKELELEEKKIDIEKEKLKLQQENNLTHTKMMEEMCNSQKMIGSAIEKMGNTTNNMNSNNTVNNFNLQVFLNDKCKDAMNIMDFVKSLKYTPEDIDRVGRLGYAEAISKLMIEGLNELDVTQRPIHCTDAKREKMYVRHDNEWKKDIESTGKLKKAIKVVGQQNMTTLDEWKDKHPQHNQPTSKHHLDYLEICNRTMTGMLDDDDKEFNKIMKTLAPATRIDKDVNDVNKNN